jgi:hypothetical protein
MIFYIHVPFVSAVEVMIKVEIIPKTLFVKRYRLNNYFKIFFEAGKQFAITGRF